MSEIKSCDVEGFFTYFDSGCCLERWAGEGGF